MDRFDKSQTARAMIVVAVLCFGAGAATRSNDVVSLKGSVVEVVTYQNIPAYVNRWCLVRDGRSTASSTNVAVVQFGEGRSRRLYAYPQTPSARLAALDVVATDIDTCSITKVDDRTPDKNAHIAGGH